MTKTINSWLQKFVGTSSFKLAAVYTVGHVIIAAIVAKMITGAPAELAAADAIVEPLVNGVWFYVLHKSWMSFQK